MFTILGGISSIIMESIAGGFQKKALNISKISSGMFRLYSYFFAILLFSGLIFIFGFDTILFKNYTDLFVIFIVCIFGGFNNLLKLSILKTTKLSELLPYENLDKLFIIIIGFFLFFSTNNGSSYITLFISILTLFVIIAFTVDFKNLKIPKTIGLYILTKIISSVFVLTTGYFLVKYSSITTASIISFFEMIVTISILFVMKDSFGTLVKQNKKFYMHRFLASFLGWTGWLISLMVLKEAGIVVTTLLGFLTIVFGIFSMRYILNDNPTKKQMTLAFIILILIGIGYYYK